MRAKDLLKVGMVCVLLAILVLTAGCASSQGEADSGGETGPVPGGDDVALGAEDDGSLIELNAGQALVVTLESNPTTGYRWEVSEVDDAVLLQMGEPEFKQAPAEGEQLVGAGGTETFSFSSSAGETTLTLVYHRPWEEDVDPLEVFSVEVVVR